MRGRIGIVDSEVEVVGVCSVWWVQVDDCRGEGLDVEVEEVLLRGRTGDESVKKKSDFGSSHLAVKRAEAM